MFESGYKVRLKNNMLKLSTKQLLFIALVLCPVLPIIWLLYMAVQIVICKLYEKQINKWKLQEINICIEDNQEIGVDYIKFTYNLSMLEDMLCHFQIMYGIACVSDSNGSLSKYGTIPMLNIVNSMMLDLKVVKQMAANANILVKLDDQSQNRILDRKNCFPPNEEECAKKYVAECMEVCKTILKDLNKKAQQLSNLSKVGLFMFQVKLNLCISVNCIRILVKDCEADIERITSEFQQNLNSDIVISEYHVGPQRA